LSRSGFPENSFNLQSQEFKDIRDQIRRNRFGGVVLFAGNVYESAVLINELQAVSRLPLLVSADFERGAAFRIADTTSFPGNGSGRHGIRRPGLPPRDWSRRRNPGPGCPLDFGSRAGCEQQSGQSCHQHTVFRRRSLACRAAGSRLYPRSEKGGV